MSRRKLGPEEIQQLEDHVKRALLEKAVKNTQKRITGALSAANTAWVNYCKTIKRPKTLQLQEQIKSEFLSRNIAELLEQSKILEGQALTDCVISLAGFACNWAHSLDSLTKTTNREDTDHA